MTDEFKDTEVDFESVINQAADLNDDEEDGPRLKVRKHPMVLYEKADGENYNITIEWPNNMSPHEAAEVMSQLLYELHSGELIQTTLMAIKFAAVQNDAVPFAQEVIERWAKKIAVKGRNKESFIAPREVFQKFW